MSQIKCPKCKTVLNPEHNIILSAKKNDENRGVLLLSSEIGDYTLHHHESFQIEEGDHILLHCPACHVDLSIFAPREKMAGLELIDEDGQKSAIIISSVVGEQCTYKVVDKEIIAYGKDAHKYSFDFESLSAWL